jgi:hypothetical protein
VRGSLLGAGVGDGVGEAVGDALGEGDGLGLFVSPPPEQADTPTVARSASSTAADRGDLIPRP